MYAYFMSAICAASGLLLILRLGREKKLYYPLGAFLLLLSGWVLADELTGGALSHSWAIWVQRAVLLIVIIALIIIMTKDIRASKAAAESGESPEAEVLEDSFVDAEKDDPTEEQDTQNDDSSADQSCGDREK